jgi:hypothetical protein
MPPVLKLKLQCCCTVSEILTLCDPLIVFGSEDENASESVYAPGSTFWLSTLTVTFSVSPGAMVPDVTFVLSHFGVIPGVPGDEFWFVVTIG